MSAGWTQRHRDLLRSVAMGRIVCDMTRGAWVGPDYKRRMGRYQWISGDPLGLRDIEALVELRMDELIVTVPVSGRDRWPVKLAPLGEATVSNWHRQGVTS